MHAALAGFIKVMPAVVEFTNQDRSHAQPVMPKVAHRGSTRYTNRPLAFIGLKIKALAKMRAFLVNQADLIS
ncbi:hypothetical protein AYJ58_09145 [Shewanella sp. Pdp11]|nr:hypothetical protein AYJ58_09145 [Shewanella sp. Pdp11]